MKSIKNEIIVYTDGGSRGNPGKAAYGFVVYQNEEKIYEEGKYLGIQTNNFAEYTAVIKALRWIKENLGEDTKINLYCDSLLVESQLNGKYKIKHPAIKPLAKEVKALESFFKEVSYSHVLRENNKEADSMVNEALDNHIE